MKKAKGRASTNLLVDAAVAGVQEVKGKDIVHLDLRSVPNTVTDHFIICHGDSATQVDAIARSVEDIVRQNCGEKPWHSEGQQNGNWILLDYVDVVVHVFHRDQRAFYGLEQLWSDAIRNNYENVA